jgi:hypothetical protein
MREVKPEPTAVLKTCPYCGAPAEILDLSYGIRTALTPACSECPARFTGTFKTREEAQDAWNRRVGTAVDGAREALAIAAKVRVEERERVAAAFEGRAAEYEQLARECPTFGVWGDGILRGREMRELAAWIRGGCKK